MHWFRIYCSLILGLLSLAAVNRLIGGSPGSLWKNALLILYISFGVLYTCKIVTEMFWLCRLNQSDAFLNKVSAGLNYVNLFINLLLVLTVLWIPKKRRYITSV